MSTICRMNCAWLPSGLCIMSDDTKMKTRLGSYDLLLSATQVSVTSYPESCAYSL
jgi:hypothetical protein